MKSEYQKDTTFWIDPEERIEFYLNNQDSFEIDPKEFEQVKNQTYWSKKEMHLVSFKDFKNSFVHWYCKHLVHLPRIRHIRVLPYYKDYKNLHSLMNFFEPFDKFDTLNDQTLFPLYFGESGSTHSIPCIRKSRRQEDDTSVIFNFRTLRLTQPCSEAIKNDIAWDRKMNNVIWRGATTGKKQRVDFVKKYFDKYDVAFATTKQKPEMANLKRKKVSIKDQLNYKFIVSLEGNDVASNLRWVLASNSVPVMTKPYWQSWIIEQKLEPNVHYLQLNDDLSNLEELLSWAESHGDECKQIALNGKKYMSQFLDKGNDLPVQKMLLDEFAKRVTYLN